jgi:hypothetical protein
MKVFAKTLSDPVMVGSINLSISESVIFLPTSEAKLLGSDDEDRRMDLADCPCETCGAVKTERAPPEQPNRTATNPKARPRNAPFMVISTAPARKHATYNTAVRVEALSQ